MTEAVFKYTFPIAKSEARSDGNYIIGYASGPEIDSEGERMSPDAIKGYSDQINASSASERIPYRDAHAPDGVLRDLGEITKAWINEQMHLGIEVKLDMSNPAAKYLWDQIERGKQYGMSVAGRVLDYADEFVAELGRKVRTYKSIMLDEISNTTRPAWYPSFGSVLAKSIKDSEETVGATRSSMSQSGSVDATDAATKQVGTQVSESETTDEGDNPLEDKDLLDEPVKDETKSDTAADGSPDVEKYSSAAADASSAAYVLANILSLLGGEDDESDATDADKLRAAAAAIQEFIAAETAEIGTPEDKQWSEADNKSDDTVDKSDSDAPEGDEDEADETGDVTDDTEKSDADDSDVEKAGKKISAATAAELRAMFENMKTALTTVGVLDEEKSSTESAPADAEDTIDKSTEPNPVDELATLKALNDDLAAKHAEATARIAELESAPRTNLPSLITDDAKKSDEDAFSELLAKASPADRIRLAFAAKTRGN